MAQHAIDRALERYGVELKIGDISRMEQSVAQGRSVLVRNNEHGATHMIQHANTVFLAIVKSTTVGPRIVTMLPPDAITAGAGLEHYRGPKPKFKRRPKVRCQFGR